MNLWKGRAPAQPQKLVLFTPAHVQLRPLSAGPTRPARRCSQLELLQAVFLAPLLVPKYQVSLTREARPAGSEGLVGGAAQPLLSCSPGRCSAEARLRAACRAARLKGRDERAPTAAAAAP